MAEIKDINPRLCNETIIIDDWRQDDTYEGVYPKGARDKSAYFSPETIKENYLKANYRYLFKLSRSWCPWQFWGEIIAYRLGLIIDVEVPPAHIGLTNKYQPGNPTYGALIEWFYDDKKDVYVEGGQLMVGLIKGYDRQKGTQHNFSDIAGAFHKTPEFIAHWSGVFTLDCLIGNTDRHQDNWGIIFKDAKIKKPSRFVLASPAFDNGTALSYEIIEENLDKFNDEVFLGSYLTNPKRARHHMKFTLDEQYPLNFYEFMSKFVLEFPESKDIIIRHLGFGKQEIADIMSPLLEAVSDNMYCLTQKRLNFILKLIFRRKELLEKVLNL